MKKIVVLLLGTILFVACKKDIPEGPGNPLFTSVYGVVVLAFPDGSTIEASSSLANRFAMDWDENCHYRTFIHQSAGRRVAIVFARSRKYSYKENPALQSLMCQHFVGWEEIEDLVVFEESDFYQVYRIKVDDQVMYQNDKVLSNTFWDQWLNDPEAYYTYFWTFHVEMNADYTLKSSAYEEFYSPKPQPQ